MEPNFRVYCLIVIDAFLIILSLLLALYLKYEGLYSDVPQSLVKNAICIAAVVILIKLICFYIFRLYRSIWKYASIFEAFLIASSVIVGNLMFMAVFKMWNLSLGLSLYGINMLTDLFIIGGSRIGYRALRKYYRRKLLYADGAKRVLIVGSGEPVAAIIKVLKLNPELRSKPVAILDDDISKKGRGINGIPIIGQPKDILKVISKKRIDEAIIMPTIQSNSLKDIYELTSKSTCKVKIIPSYSEIIDEKVVIQKIREIRLEDLLGRDPVNIQIDEIFHFFDKKTVLITGGGGSIGSELCRQIASHCPQKLIVLDSYENGIFEIQTELKGAFPGLNLVAVIANIREKDKLYSVFKEHMPDLIYHAAAYKHVPLMEDHPGEAVKNNILGTLNVAECAYECKVKKFVMISTDKAVKPKSVMGATKKIAEMIIHAVGQNSSTEFVTVRFGNVLGSSGSVIPVFKKQIKAGGPVTVTHPEVTRYFMTIPEAVQLVIEASIIAEGGEIFVLDMGNPVKIYDLAKNLIKLSGFEPDEDIKIEFVGLREGEKLYEELFLCDEKLKQTVIDKIFVAHSADRDINGLRNKLGELKSIDLNNPEEAINFIRSLLPDFRKI